MLSSFFTISLQGVVAVKTPATDGALVCEQELKQTTSKAAAKKSLMCAIKNNFLKLKED
jgi:hypothetical protein